MTNIAPTLDPVPNEQLTVLHVAPIHHNHICGLTSAIPPAISCLQELGATTGMITTSRRGRYEAYQSFPVRDARDLPLARMFSSLAPPLNNPDLLVFHSTYIPFHVPLWIEAVARKIPYIVLPHGGMTRQAQATKGLKKGIANLLFFDRMISGALALHCLSETEALSIARWKKPIIVEGNGIELPSPEKLANPGGLPPYTFVFIGRMDIHIKGLDLLVDACAAIKEKLEKAAIKIKLYGTDRGKNRERLIELIRERGLKHLLTVHPPVQGEAKERVLREADVFLLTSRTEGHPIAVLEALSYGVPCLVTPQTTMAHEIAQSGAGWGAFGTLADTLSKAIDELHLLPEKGRAARMLAESRYSWPIVGKRVLHKYKKLLSLKAAGKRLHPQRIE